MALPAGGTWEDSGLTGFFAADTTVTAPYLLVALSGDHTVTLAGVADDPIGAARNAGLAAGDPIAVFMLDKQGTLPFVAAGAISQNAPFYRAASGKVSATPAGAALGIALEATSGNNSVFEGMPLPNGAAPSAPHKIADPGNAGAIPVTKSGVCNLTTAGAETRTMAAPAFDGERITLNQDVYAGACVITVASLINRAGNNTITTAHAADFVDFVGTRVAGALRWMVVNSEGVTLSTV